MKGKISYFSFSTLLLILIMASCGTPVSITAMRNQGDNSKISKVVIMPLFEKLEYTRPFEQTMSNYFNQKGLKSIGSLDFLNPTIKYPISEIKRKCDSLGADAILVINYRGTDKTDTYTPGMTYVTGGFGGYWGGGYWGGGFYGGGYYGTAVTTGGYWTTTSVIILKADLYTHASKNALWTAEIKVTDPKFVDEAAAKIAAQIYSNWKNDNMLKQ